MAQKEAKQSVAETGISLLPLDDKGISVHAKTLKRWYQLIHLGRILDQKAAL